MQIPNVVSDILESNMDDDGCYELDTVQIFWWLRGKSNPDQPPIQFFLIEIVLCLEFWKISKMSYGVQAWSTC